MLKKRSWADISIDILESALTPTTKTRLMYRSNLNFSRFNTYFYDFLQKGLLEKKQNGDRNGTIYVTSKQGKTLLSALRTAERLFSETSYSEP